MRTVADTDYVECLQSEVYRRHYFRWRERMLKSIDTISGSLRTNSVPEVMEAFNLTPRDMALLVRLHYFTPEEIAELNLEKLIEGVPT